MLRRAGDRLTYANTMATIAVFIALGGGAYAATKLPHNAVGAPQIKPDAVTSPKVKDGSLLASDFKAGQLPVGAGGPGAKGDAGPQGPQGAPGQSIKGDTGDTGSAAASAVFGGIAHLGTLAPSAKVFSNPAAFVSSPAIYNAMGPNAPVTLRDFDVHQNNGPLPANVTLKVDLDTDSGSITCTIPTGGTDCNTGAQTTTIPPGAVIAVSIENTGTATYSGTPEVDWGWRATG